MVHSNNIEELRQEIQVKLDKQKSQIERNKLGQFSTPTRLANDILRHTLLFFNSEDSIRFLDPCIGTGSFFSALMNIFPSNRIKKAVGYEIDEHYGKPAIELWNNSILNYNIGDFTKEHAPNNNKDKFNLIVCNPPYVRHHHLKDEKERLKLAASNSANIKLSGLSGLYCYFIALAHNWMASNGIAVWLIPSEFMDVNYGDAIKKYLLNEVTLLQIHRFNPNDIQFTDALVTSSIIWFKKQKSQNDYNVRFTFGGSIANPDCSKIVSKNVLLGERKWTRFPLLEERLKDNSPQLNDFFSIKRGIATGDNDFFILSMDDIRKRNLPIDFFKPILPSPRNLSNTVIFSDDNEYPVLDRQLFVFDCQLSIEEIHNRFPNLYDYLLEGVHKGVPERFLCKNRKIWYQQEHRMNSLFYCTYIGRSDKIDNKPFRFVLNYSKAIVTNSYLILYPKAELEVVIKDNPKIIERLHFALNNITKQSMINEGRVYGGGMHKLEPKELSKLPAAEIKQIISDYYSLD